MWKWAVFMMFIALFWYLRRIFLLVFQGDCVLLLDVVNFLYNNIGTGQLVPILYLLFTYLSIYLKFSKMPPCLQIASPVFVNAKKNV